MPRIRGKDASNKAASSGTQLEAADGPQVRSRAPRRQISRQEKRRRMDHALHEDAERHHMDTLHNHAQSVGKRPKGNP